MKITKTASGKTEVKLSKQEWINIGKKAGWSTTKAPSEDYQRTLQILQEDFEKETTENESRGFSPPSYNPERLAKMIFSKNALTNVKHEIDSILIPIDVNSQYGYEEGEELKQMQESYMRVQQELLALKQYVEESIQIIN